MSLFFHHRSNTTKSKTMRHGSYNNHQSNHNIEKEKTMTILTGQLSCPVDVDDTDNLRRPVASLPSPPRIPIALQKIFLQSNRGEEVHVPPPKHIASRIFRKFTIGGRRRLNNNRLGVVNAFRKTKNRHPTNDVPVVSSTTSIEDHTTGSSSTTGSNSSSTGDAAFIVQVNATNHHNSTAAVPSSSSSSLLLATAAVATATTTTTHYEDIVVVHPLVQKVTLKKEISLKVTPLSYVDAILQSRGYDITKYPSLQTSYYNHPTLYQQTCYDTYLLRLVKEQQPSGDTNNCKNRNNNLHSLKLLFQAGISSNPCNAHGESLLHTICRLGNTSPGNCNAGFLPSSSSSLSYEILQIMISTGHCDIRNCVDDYGRTPLHDACWCNSPCYDTISLLLRTDPTLLVLQDCRGATPLSYIPPQHHTTFIEYISYYKDLFFPNRNESGKPSQKLSQLQFPSKLVHELPNTRPVPDPTNVLSHDVARMVVSGRITPQELTILLLQDDDDDEESESSYDDDEDDDDEEGMTDDEDDSSTLLSAEGDFMIPNKKMAPTPLLQHTDIRDVSALSDDDDDAEKSAEESDDEESYSELDEMLMRLNVQNSAMVSNNNAIVSHKEPTDAVLGISRPQYGYDMLHQMKHDDSRQSDKETTKHTTITNDNYLTVGVDDIDTIYNDDDTTCSFNGLKPMLSVMIPTIRSDTVQQQPLQKSVQSPSVVTLTSLSSSSPISSSKNEIVVGTNTSTNGLLEFSV